MDERSAITVALTELASNDTLQTAIKAGISMIPVVGGPIASIMGDVRSKTKFKELMGLIKELQERVRGVEDQLDKDYVTQDEFISLFERAAKEYVSTPDAVKKDYLAGLIVTSMRGPEDYYERDYYLRKVVELPAIHLELMRLYYDPEKALLSKGINPESVEGEGYTQVVRRYLPGTNLGVIRSAHRDLFNMGFLNTDSDVFGITMAGTGIHVIKGRVTDVGARFVVVCLPFPQSDSH